jgi:hypothetical protein
MAIPAHAAAQPVSNNKTEPMKDTNATDDCVSLRPTLRRRYEASVRNPRTKNAANAFQLVAGSDDVIRQLTPKRQAAANEIVIPQYQRKRWFIV